MNLIEASKQALEALEYAHATCRYENERQSKAIAGLREAIAEAGQAEPVKQYRGRFAGLVEALSAQPATQQEPSCEDVKLVETILSDCGHSTENTRLLIACLRPPPAQPISRNQVRDIFMRHGFVIKEGHDDLKEYVYSAAQELIDAAMAAQQQDPSAPQLRIADLEAQVSKLTQTLADPMTTGIEIGNGSMSVGLEGGGAQLLAGMFVGMLDANPGAANYLESRFDTQHGQIVVTVMRPGGKTPHQVRQDAEQRIVELDAEVERFRTYAMNEKSARQSLEHQLAAQRKPLEEVDRDKIFRQYAGANDHGVPYLCCYRDGFRHIVATIEAARGITKGST